MIETRLNDFNLDVNGRYFTENLITIKVISIKPLDHMYSFNNHNMLFCYFDRLLHII